MTWTALRFFTDSQHLELQVGFRAADLSMLLPVLHFSLRAEHRCCDIIDSHMTSNDATVSSSTKKSKSCVRGEMEQCELLYGTERPKELREIYTCTDVTFQ